MDAYDIFKKLTKGLQFKERVYGVKNKEETTKLSEVRKEEYTKKELLSEEEYESDGSGKQSEPEGLSGEDGSADEDIELVEGLKVGAKKKKKNKKEKSEDLKKKLELEELNRFRNEHGIKTVGRHVPAALADFSDLIARYNVSEKLVATIKECGYSEPTAIQRQSLPCMLEDRQILACAPTGSGKTVAFLVPVLQTLGAPQGGPRALVVCPTRELAHQIYREAVRLSAGTELRCSVVRSLKASKIKEREATFRKSDIVISTPNRLCYLLNQDKVNISLEKIRWLIIDEADKMFEGSADQEGDFRQQMTEILSACGPKRRAALFSATHTPAVAKWCRHNLRGLINITVGRRNAATSLVQQSLVFCGNEAGKLLALRQLVKEGLKPPVLVFVQSKDRAKQLFKELLYDGINVDVIHADRTQTQRDNVVRSFRIGRVWVVICTELLARGIDFRGVNLVINYDFPPSAIAYIHRIGRAGRAGQPGRGVTFFTQDDVGNLRSIASVMKQSGCEVPEYMLAMKQNPNKRKKLAKKAPRRDDISTVLQKRPDKRKLDPNESKDEDKTKDTNAVNGGANKKQRRVQNGDQDGGKFRKSGKNRQKFKKNGVKNDTGTGKGKNNKKKHKNGKLNKNKKNVIPRNVKHNVPS